MLKKAIIASIICISALVVQFSPQAQELWIGEIIFEKKPTPTTRGFAINELAYTLIKLHTITAGHDIASINYEWEELWIIKSLEELTKKDIIHTLDLAKDKQAALSEYLQATYEVLHKANTLSAYIRQEMERIKSDMEACLIDKSISDKMYFEAMNMYDQSIMDKALVESIYYETCASEKRIQYNAKVAIAKRVVLYLWLLQKKYDLLFAKQDIVTQNFEVFRDNLLPELNQIDQFLQQYTF